MRAIRLPALSIAASFGASAATWVLLQQFAVRGLVAIKFLAIGRMLGPAAIGSVSVALLAVAIAEALSDTGLAQAVIQGEHPPTRSQLGAVWTTLTARGVLISLLLVALAPLLSSQFHLNGSLVLIQLAALLPLLRGLASPTYYVVQRERRFQHIAGVEIAASFVDCSVGLALAYFGAGAISVLIGLVAGESLKSILTWSTMKPRPPIRAVWSGIGHYVGFSRWIWASSVVNLLLNQFDKVVVGKLLGPAQLGGYQMSSRLAQMLLAEHGREPAGKWLVGQRRIEIYGHPWDADGLATGGYRRVQVGKRFTVRQPGEFGQEAVEQVEYAITRLMSFCTMPISPVQNAVVAPMSNTKLSAVCDSSNSGDMRATMKMPAVTIVAAWISAEIGVGPSIESGSHTCSGNCADLPVAPMNRQMQATVSRPQSVPGKLNAAS